MVVSHTGIKSGQPPGEERRARHDCSPLPVAKVRSPTWKAGADDGELARVRAGFQPALTGRCLHLRV